MMVRALVVSVGAGGATASCRFSAPPNSSDWWVFLSDAGADVAGCLFSARPDLSDG